MAKCIVIADDLTGANATGVLLKKMDYNTYTMMNAERLELSLSDSCDCLMYPTDSRGIDKELAYNRVYNAAKLLFNSEVKVWAKRIDSTKPGTITYHLIPQSSEDYWVSIPQKLSHTNKNKVRILLNGNNYEFQDKFQQTQFIQIAHNSVGKSIELTIEIDTDDEYNLSGLRLARSNSTLVDRIIEERQLQGLKVTHWDDRHIQGTVSITDDSTWMMTSIPYEKGWTVRVDGQVVKTIKVWDSLLAFAVTPGEHTVEITYIPEGFMAGLLISILSICIYVLAIYKKWI